MRLFGTTLVALALAGCSTGPNTDQPPLLNELPRPLSAGEAAAVAANNRFGFELLGRAVTGDPAANAFISPLSVSLALGMVMNGARGSTHDAMASVLGFGSLDQPTINSSYQSLIALLLGLDGSTDVTIANSLWVDRAFAIAPSFVSESKQYFDADARTIDFRGANTVTTINQWVAEKTKGKIRSILDQIDPAEVLFAINATYFKGAWRSAFSRQDTRLGVFTDFAGLAQSVPFMSQELEVLHASTASYEAAELWYGNGAWAMTIVLPARGTDVNALAASLDAPGWSTLVQGLTKTNLFVLLPKFKLEYSRKLKDDLTALGMGIAFSDSADLSGISDADRLLITRVDHKTFVEVNEEGTEAAAVTNVGVGLTSAPPSFTVDRPFVFAIRERLSGTVVFLGRVNSIPDA